jgi:hypothetical protein
MHPHEASRSAASPMPAPWWVRLAFVGFLAIAGFFLVVEHGAHLFGALPYVLFGTFFALHMGMHAGHRHGGHRHGDAQAPDAQDEGNPPASDDRPRGGHQH